MNIFELKFSLIAICFMIVLTIISHSKFYHNFFILNIIICIINVIKIEHIDNLLKSHKITYKFI